MILLNSFGAAKISLMHLSVRPIPSYPSCPFHILRRLHFVPFSFELLCYIEYGHNLRQKPAGY